MVLAGDFVPLPQVPAHELLVFLMQVGLLLLTALVLGRLAVKLRFPSVAGELLAGVLIGPTVFGHLTPGVWAWLFPGSAAQTHMTDGLSQLGLLLLVGLTGAQLDLAQVRRRGRAAMSVSLGGLLVPLAIGIAVGFALPAALLSATTTRPTFAIFLGVAMCVSAIPVIAKTLIDMRLIHRDVGQLTLAAGMVDDTVGWFLLSVVSAMAAGSVHGWRMALTVGELFAFVAVAALLGRPAVRWAFRLAGRGESAGPSVATAVVVVLAGAVITHSMGLEAVFGAFVAGALIGAPGMATVVSPTRLVALRTFVMWVGAPIFLATAGLRMDLTVLGDPTVLVAAVVVLAVAIVGKFAGAYLGGRLSRLPRRECLAIGAGMNARGVVEVVVALAGLRLGVLTTATYTIIVLVAVITSLMAPPLLRLVMAGVDHTAEERLREKYYDSWTGVPEPTPLPVTGRQ
jgi:Kef-type K+ transport system membrane component KefB